MNTLKQKPSDELKVEEVYKGPWKNVYFNSKGSSGHLGHKTFQSEDQARKAAQECEASKDETIKELGTYNLICQGCGFSEPCDSSHFSIQMPVGEK